MTIVITNNGNGKYRNIEKDGARERERKSVSERSWGAAAVV